MPSLLFSPAAQRDLREIADYIARDSKPAARRWVTRLMEQCRRVSERPLGYVAREDLLPGLRMAAIGRYLIFFRVVDKAVRIERVLHSARNVQRLLGSGADDGDQ